MVFDDNLESVLKCLHCVECRLFTLLRTRISVVPQNFYTKYLDQVDCQFSLSSISVTLHIYLLVLNTVLSNYSSLSLPITPPVVPKCHFRHL
jgi:hypothetical protein